MEEHLYRISLKAPIGLRLGSLCLDREGKSISGWMELFHHRKALAGSLDAGGVLRLTGEMETLFTVHPFTAEGRIEGERVELRVTTAAGIYPVIGEELSEA